MPAPEQAVFLEALAGVARRVADGEPASVTTLQTNTPTGYVYIEPPGEGNLWVLFVYQGDPPAEAWMWDGQRFIPIPPNVQTVLAYRTGCRLVYKLGFATQKITLSWGFE